jgi:hypothetical protein
MSLKIEIEKKFGDVFFKNAPFYHYANNGALRFELEKYAIKDDEYCSYFFKSLKIAEEIVKEIFKNEEKITICIRHYSNGKAIDSKYILKLAKEFSLITKKNYEFSINSDIDTIDNELIYSNYIYFQTDIKHLITLLWFAINKTDIIRPISYSDVYLFNLEKEILCYPYDERGMDVVGSEIETNKLFNKFYNYLLDCDLKLMKNFHKKFD